MKIYEVFDKKKYIALLLLADEQESLVDKYIDDGRMFVLDDDGVKGEILVCRKEVGIAEIKNLAVYPEYQGRGYGRALIEFVCELYGGNNSYMEVGTGDSPLTVPFYEKCGFKKSHVIKNFFTDNYSKKIFEGGVQLVDMVYLRKRLK